MSDSKLRRQDELNREILAAVNTISDIFDFGTEGMTNEQRDEIAKRIYGIGLDEVGLYASHSVHELIKSQAAQFVVLMQEHDVDNPDDLPEEVQLQPPDVTRLMGYQWMDGITVGMMLMLTRMAEGYDFKAALDALDQARR